MVYTSTSVGDFAHGGIDPASEHFGCALHAVAQACNRDPGIPLHSPAKHGHGVGVIEQDGVGAVSFHVPTDIQHDLHSTQKSEDASRSPSVAHVDVDTEFFWDLDIASPDANRRS